MSVEDQVEAAWKKYRPEALSTNSMALSRDVFTAGYLAALRSLYREIKPSEMVVGRHYWVGGMIGEMQGFRSITGADGITRQWPIVDGVEVCPDLFVIIGPVPNGSDLPSPSDLSMEGRA